MPLSSRVYAELDNRSHLPTLRLSIDEAADGLHDGSVNRLGAAKPSGENRPILGPADAVFNPYTDRTQL